MTGVIGLLLGATPLQDVFCTGISWKLKMREIDWQLSPQVRLDNVLLGHERDLESLPGALAKVFTALADTQAVGSVILNDLEVSIMRRPPVAFDADS